MYMLKKKLIVGKQKDFAKQVGITPETFSAIQNRKIGCSKLTAYCITKNVNINSEVDNFFERVED